MTSIDSPLPRPSPRPLSRPSNIRFSSGPCSKRPGWSPSVLESALLGRSHRSSSGKERLRRAIDLTRNVLEVPSDYRIGIVPASDTGAVEMALWSMVGCRPVTLSAWESFGMDWVKDVSEQLKLDARILTADYGELPDFLDVDFSGDFVFTWNGTTSGVRVPNADFIPSDREGLVICDATSAAFSQRLDFPKLDVTTFSWQKVMGGEAAHGILILSPRAVERLESWTPPWPLPKIFRMVKDKKLNEGLFEGATLNTPSMLCVEDYIDTLTWGLSVGGLDGLVSRTESNFGVLESWVDRTDWIDFLAKDVLTRSNTSVCLSIIDPRFLALDESSRRDFVNRYVSLLADEGAAYDIGSYTAAPAGLRIWTGATIETSDVEHLTPWLDWAYGTLIEEV